MLFVLTDSSSKDSKKVKKETMPRGRGISENKLFVSGIQLNLFK